MKDHVNAFMDHPDVPVSNAESGPLAGLTLAVKDIYDVAGYKTGCGSPVKICLLYTSPSPRDLSTSRMPSSA